MVAHLKTLECARGWASELVRRESRGSGDNINAMRRLGARHGIPWRVFWSLKYRPPKDIFADTYLRLWNAYRREAERQLRILEHELEITRLVAGPDHHSVRAAETLVGQAHVNPNERITDATDSAHRTTADEDPS